MSFKELARRLRHRIFPPPYPPRARTPLPKGAFPEDPPLSPEQMDMARSYLEGRDELEGMPRYLVLELTNACNLSCLMCPRKDMTRETGFMDSELFRRVVEEAEPFLEMIYLHFMGESLLHEEIRECIEFASGKGITVALATNSTLLTEERIESLLRSRLDALLLSFDGGSAEVLERIRRGADFLSSREGILRLLQKTGEGYPHLNPVIQLIRMTDNKADIENFLMFWNEVPQARVKIKDLHDFGNQLDDLKRLKHGAEGIPPAPPGLVCYEPWRGLVVGWDGRVLPCCNDYDARSVLGNLREESLGAIWNGEKMKNFRNTHRQGKRGGLALCRNCLPPSVSEREAFQIFSPFSPSLYELQSYWNRGLQHRESGDPDLLYALSDQSELYVQDRTGTVQLTFAAPAYGSKPLPIDLFLCDRLLGRTTLAEGGWERMTVSTPAEFRGRLLRFQIRTHGEEGGKNPPPDPKIFLRSIRNW